MKAIAYLSAILIGGAAFAFLRPGLGFGALAIAAVIAFILQPIIYHTLHGIFGRTSHHDNGNVALDKTGPGIGDQRPQVSERLADYPADESKTKPVILFGNAQSGYTINPDMHKVANPQRALDTYLSEGVAVGAKHLALATAAAAGLAGFGLLFYSKVLFPESGNPLYPIYNTLGVVVGFVGVPIVFVNLVQSAIKAYGVSRTLPDRRTAVGTLEAFYSAVELGLWRRAYNCLTDPAQDTAELRLPREHPLQQKMPEIVRIDSLASFKGFWSNLPFSCKPLWDEMESDPIDEHSVIVNLHLRATWSIANGDKQEQKSEDLGFPFLLVRRGGYWFLCNGFFWPLAANHSSSA
jgi:hypothetical protein